MEFVSTTKLAIGLMPKLRVPGF